MRDHPTNNANLALLILLALASDEDAGWVLIERRLLEWLFEEWLHHRAEYSTKQVKKTDNALEERP